MWVFFMTIGGAYLIGDMLCRISYSNGYNDAKEKFKR